MGDEYDDTDMVVEHNPYLQRLKELYDEVCRWAGMIRNQPANQVARDNFQRVMNQSHPISDEEDAIYRVVRGMYHLSNHGYMGIVGAHGGGKYIFFTDSLKILNHFGVSEYIFMTFNSEEDTYIVKPRDDRGLNFSSSDYGFRSDRGRGRGRGESRGGYSDRGRGDRGDRGRGREGGHRGERGSEFGRERRGGYSDRGRDPGSSTYQRREPREQESLDIKKMVHEAIRGELATITEEARKAQRKAKYIPKSIKRAEEAALREELASRDDQREFSPEVPKKPAAAEPKSESKVEPKAEPKVDKKEASVPASEIEPSIPKQKKIGTKKPAASDETSMQTVQATDPAKKPEAKKVESELVKKPEAKKVEPEASAEPKPDVTKVKKSAKTAKTAAKSTDIKPEATRQPIPKSKSWADDVETGEEMKFD
jgi:hypothetical protein